MKNSILFTVLCFVIFSLTSCDEDIKVAKSIDGTWSIAKVVSPSLTEDLVDVGTITFDACNFKRGETSRCDGSVSVTLDGKQYDETFTFQTGAGDALVNEDEFADVITISNISNTELADNPLRMDGSKTIETLSDTEMILTKGDMTYTLIKE